MQPSMIRAAVEYADAERQIREASIVEQETASTASSPDILGDRQARGAAR